MRYEKKFRISKSDFPLFLSLINKLKFKVHYESRFISSIYYDTINFNLYRDSINGVSEAELRRFIREQINESKWHQFKGNLKNLAKSTGISSGKLGDDKNFRDYIEFVFSQKSYVDKLHKAKMNFMGPDGHRNPDELLKELNQISVEALPVYLGFAFDQILSECFVSHWGLIVQALDPEKPFYH